MKLDYVQWDITSACNLNCLHCRGEKTNSNKNDLTLKYCYTLINQIVAANTHTLSIAGGEPLLAPNIWNVLKYANGKFRRLVVSTNGTIVNPRTAKLLAELTTNVQVSLDGHTDKVHDYIRGKGNFVRAIKAIKLLQEEGANVAVRLTLCKENKDSATEFVCLAKELGLPEAFLRRMIPSGNAKKCGLHTLSSDELKENIGKAIEWGKQIGIHVASADYFCQIEFNEKSRKNAVAMHKYAGKKIGGCAIGFNSFYVMHNGIIAYCPYLPVFCGDLRKQTLLEIWKTSRMMKVARNLRFNLKGKCSVCKYKFACGGCRAYAYATNGDILSEDTGCWINAPE